jgi:hypothetical protein
LEEAGGKASRTLVLLLIVVLTVAIVSTVVFIFCGRVESRTVVLPMIQEKNLTILENGDAVLRLSTTTSPSQLANLYSKSLDEMGENAFMDAFREGVQKEYKILMGIDVNVADSQISVGPDNEARISVEATAQQVSRFNTSEDAWEIEVRPPEENGKEAAGFMLIQMMFAQQMLKSLPEDQGLDYTSSIPIKLPEGATILNVDELSGKVWRVDFGGGSYREASLSVVNSREVRLTERIVVTEQPPAAPDENLFEELFNYKIFTIKYRLPGQALGFAAAAISDKRAPAAKPNTDFSWSFDWTISYPFSIPLTYTVSSTEEGTTAQVTAEVELTGTAEFTFKWYIGWDFDWVQKSGWGGIPYRAYELQWFRTYVEINPQINVNATTTITGQLTHEWEKDIYDWSHPVTVFVGPVPVVIEVRLDIGAGVEVGVEASLTVSAGVNASTTFRLGVEWTKDNEWQPIKEQTYSFTHTGPEITGVGVRAWVTPYLKLRLGAYFYWTAGPFVELKPLATATLTPDNWLIEAGFDINAGVGFGAISEWVDLPDWSTTLYSWRTPIASGTWAAPTGTPTGTQTTTPITTTTPTTPGGGIETATSLAFKMDYLSENHDLLGTMTIKAKNIGSENMKVRNDMNFAGIEAISIINGEQRKSWLYENGQWRDRSSNFSEDWRTWTTQIEVYKNFFSGWTGGEFTTVVGSTTVRIYDIELNPALNDSLFVHSE